MASRSLPRDAHVQQHRRIAESAVRLSLIIPTLQEESTLESTLAAFPLELRQRFGVELIISDGGSTDGTLAIAERHADLLVVYRGTQRQSIAQGRNWGAAVACAPVLIFLNADTIPADPPGFLERITTWAERCPQEIALCCPVRVHPAHEQLQDRIFHWLYNRYVWLLNALGIGMGRGECHIVRAEPFWHVGGYDERLYAGEDFDLYRRLRRLRRIRMEWTLLVYESPRRYRRYGYARTLALWTANALAAWMLGRSLVRAWQPVRSCACPPSQSPHQC